MRIFTHLPKMPIALAGVALWTAGITGAWASVVGSSVISIIGAGVAILLILPIIFKYISHPSLFVDEISNPTLGSVIPTLDMAIMLIASVIETFATTLGRTLWLVAIALHVIFFCRFLYYRIKDFDINHMIPSWFVPPIGIVVACVSGAEMGYPLLTSILFYFGLTMYIIMLPFMFYRMFFGDKIEDSRIPSFGVMGAPANLCLAGYLTAFVEPNYYLATTLAYLGVFTTCLVYISLFRVFKIKFIPLYASYTFPLGIGATAMIKYVQLLKNQEIIPEQIINIWQSIANIELFIASIMIFYVFVNLNIFIWKSIKQS